MTPCVHARRENHRRPKKKKIEVWARTLRQHSRSKHASVHPTLSLSAPFARHKAAVNTNTLYNTYEKQTCTPTSTRYRISLDYECRLDFEYKVNVRSHFVPSAIRPPPTTKRATGRHPPSRILLIYYLCLCPYGIV